MLISSAFTTHHLTMSYFCFAYTTFTGIKVPFVDYGKLQTAIERTLDTLNLQRMATFITKVIQVGN